jgi:hypothetical protein
MRRAKLKYSIEQNKKGNYDMLYNVLTCKDNWIYVEYFKLKKAKQLLKKMEENNNE